MPPIFSFVVIIRGWSQQSQFTFSENAKEPCGCSHQLVQPTKCQLSLWFSIGLQAQDCMDTVEKFTLTSTILSHLVLFCNNCIYKKKTRFAPLPYPRQNVWDSDSKIDYKRKLGICEILMRQSITGEKGNSHGRFKKHFCYLTYNSWDWEKIISKVSHILLNQYRKITAHSWS